MRQLRRSVAVFFESTPISAGLAYLPERANSKPDHFVEAGVVTA
jgi:hypothetical protein